MAPVRTLIPIDLAVRVAQTAPPALDPGEWAQLGELDAEISAIEEPRADVRERFPDRPDEVGPPADTDDLLCITLHLEVRAGSASVKVWLRPGDAPRLADIPYDPARHLRPIEPPADRAPTLADLVRGRNWMTLGHPGIGGPVWRVAAKREATR